MTAFTQWIVTIFDVPPASRATLAFAWQALRRFVEKHEVIQ